MSASLFTGRGVEIPYYLPQVSVTIRGATFSADLRVLDTKGIDVILGMDTLAKWGVRIDYAQRTVHLSEEGRGVDEDLS